MTATEFLERFASGLATTSPLEYIAVVAGIVSVWFSRKENILVYPIGLVNTIIYIFISLQYHLPGEASVNLYYTIMSVYGWYLWLKKNEQQEKIVHISYSNSTMWLQQIAFFLFFYGTIYFSLIYLKDKFFAGAIPWADAFASATAFTAMWLMTRKKVESWYWWIATNMASIPLYFVKGLVVTSVYYFILLIMAVFGLIEWRNRSKQNHA